MPAKKGFNIKDLLAAKAKEDATMSQVKTIDPCAIKLMNVPNFVSEEEIKAALMKFGKVVRCFIPTEETRDGKKRRRNFAIVSYDDSAAATRAVEEAEITVDMAILSIERAMAARPRENRDRPNLEEFKQLTRNKK